MIELDRLHVEVFVPAPCLASVTQGAPVFLTLTRSGARIPATVRDVGREIDAPTGLQNLMLEIENANRGTIGGERMTLKLPIPKINQ